MPNYEFRPLRSAPLPPAPTSDGVYLLRLTVDTTPAAGVPENNLEWVDATAYVNA